jgi:hypothetical protein
METEELIEPETVRGLVQFLELNEEEMILQGLGALDTVFALARAVKEDRRGAMGGCDASGAAAM